ncbi:MAG: hypothetical protein P3W91_002000 [Fervidobacterium sp.]|nr:hypothetical protein [Fervidobacterium sp.]
MVKMPEVEIKLRTDTPQVGVVPYRQVHAHSTGNPTSTVQNEVDNQINNRPQGFANDWVGNSRIVRTSPLNRGAYDVGGGWNAETFASVELIESHRTFEEFYADYQIYVNHLRNLADQGGIPKTLDSPALEGIKTHEYCTYNQPNNGSDHTDPYPYLAKWGISRAQFKNDVEQGFTIETNKTKKREGNVMLLFKEGGKWGISIHMSVILKN